MDGMLKGPPSIVAPPTHNDSKPIFAMEQGVPVDILEYFNIDPNDYGLVDKKQLNEIFNICVESCESKSELLEKLKFIENKIGVPLPGESRPVKIHRYLKVSKRIEELEKQRKTMENDRSELRENS